MIKLSSAGPVVMVDDNGGDIFFVERCFDASKVDNPFLSFRRGQEFLAMLEQVKTGQKAMPSLVLLDLNMPGMNGLDVLTSVRADPFFNVMPIFCVLTSSRDPRDKERAQALQVSGFFTKAATMEEYISFFDALVA
jgi:CheY-like chemotaxis protein